MIPQLFRCMTCGLSGLQQHVDTFNCNHCAATFGMSHGVPILLKNVQTTPSSLTITDAMMQGIMQYIGQGSSAELQSQIRQIFATEYHLGDFSLTAENNYFFQRTGISAAATIPTTKPISEEGLIAAELLPYQLPPFLSLEENSSWNIRLRNSGTRTIAQQEYQLYSHWTYLTGEPVAVTPERTELPIDLPAHQAISIPLFVPAMKVAGHFHLHVELRHCRTGTVVGTPLQKQIEIMPYPYLDTLPNHWVQTHLPQESYDYYNDHALARSFLINATRHLPNPTILEVGGCCQPQTRYMPGTIYCTDIDIQTLQLGELMFRDSHPQIHFIAADALAQPFADHSFDITVMFAAFHHMSDPLRCLLELRRVTKPTGVIALLCEPIGNYRAETLSTAFRQELEHGINEQIFTHQEYQYLFQQAGLMVVQATIDRGSFKVLLQADGTEKLPRAIEFNPPSKAWLAYRKIRKSLRPVKALLRKTKLFQ